MFWEDRELSATAQAALSLAMKLTATAQADPEHFLIAMLGEEESVLSRACRKARPGVNISSLRDTLVTAARATSPSSVPTSWSDELLSDRSRKMLASLDGDPLWRNAENGSADRLLAGAALEAARPRIRRVFEHIGAEPSEMIDTLRRPTDAAIPKPVPFDELGNVRHQAFDKTGRAVLGVLETEGKGLGLKRIGTPLILFGLLSKENGLLERALRLQLIDPRRVHQTVLMNLKALGKNRFDESFTLERSRMQSAVVRALERSADLAQEVDLPLIGEAELFKAILQENDFFITSVLQSHKVDLKELSNFAVQHHSGQIDESNGEEESLPSLADVEARLRRSIVGQDHVIDTVMPILKRLRFGYTRPNRPMAVLLFLGNSGTGKTQLAKEIAKAIYGSDEKLIFMEMGQFGTEYTKTIFVGAPPGYKGYGEGLLTNGLRDKPESVVLFDEVEKADKSVFDVLLRFLDEGQIADPAGPVRDGRRCVIILTSNHALDMLQPLIDKQSEMRHLSSTQRAATRQEIRQAILATQFFRPEFINRVDELLLFNTFGEDEYRRILINQLEVEKSRLREEKDLDVDFVPELIEHLVRQCKDRSDEGARVCGKLISDQIIAPLIDFLLQDGEGSHSVRMSADEVGNITIHGMETASAAKR